MVMGLCIWWSILKQEFILLTYMWGFSSFNLNQADWSYYILSILCFQ